MKQTAGVVVLAAAAAGTGLAVYAISRDLLVIAVWITGWALIYRVARTRNPAPPAPPERGPAEKPQVNNERIIRDTTHPNRWIVTRPSPWLTHHEPADQPDDTTGTP